MPVSSISPHRSKRQVIRLFVRSGLITLRLHLQCWHNVVQRRRNTEYFPQSFISQNYLKCIQDTTVEWLYGFNAEEKWNWRDGGSNGPAFDEIRDTRPASRIPILPWCYKTVKRVHPSVDDNIEHTLTRFKLAILSVIRDSNSDLTTNLIFTDTG